MVTDLAVQDAGMMEAEQSNDSDNTEGRVSLYGKLAAVAGEAVSVEKDGKNEQLGYKYATPAAVMGMIKPLLAAHRLAIVPAIMSVEKQDTGSKTRGGEAQVLTRLNMVFTVLDGDTGSTLSIPWCGEGLDWSDKGIAKAQTIAIRTFLLNLFQIPSMDEGYDPDGGSGQGQSGNQEQHAHPPQRPARPQPQPPAQKSRPQPQTTQPRTESRQGPPVQQPPVVVEATGEIVEVESERDAAMRKLVGCQAKLSMNRAELKRFAFAHFGVGDSGSLSTAQIAALAEDLNLYSRKSDVVDWMHEKLTSAPPAPNGAQDGELAELELARN